MRKLISLFALALIVIRASAASAQTAKASKAEPRKLQVDTVRTAGGLRYIEYSFDESCRVKTYPAYVVVAAFDSATTATEIAVSHPHIEVDPDSIEFTHTSRTGNQKIGKDSLDMISRQCVALIDALPDKRTQRWSTYVLFYR